MTLSDDSLRAAWPQPGELPDNLFHFDITAQDPKTHARCGVFHTAHGDVPTPIFMPVGTKATVKGLMPSQVADLGAKIILNNTYHLAMRPGADLVADDVDVIVAVATPTAATMLAAVEDTDIPVVYSAVTDPAAAGFDTEPNITGTSDALNTDAIMNLILAVNPDIDTIGLLYDLSQDASTQAIADAKAFCDEKGIKYIEKNGTTTAEVQMAAEALIASGVKVVFTPTDNTVMTAELSIYETFAEAGIQHYTGADSFALNGAFVGYGVDYVQLGEATADMVVELLCDGKTPADLPFQTFDNGIATINTETCAALGLSLDTVKEAFKPYCTEVAEVETAENF